MSTEQPAGESRLYDEFEAPTPDDWRAEVERLLRGASFESRMFTPTYEGISLRPVYTAADLENLEHLDSRPGQSPYVRGSRPLGYRHQPWLVAQEITCRKPADFNAALRHDLARGQTAVNLSIGDGATAIDSFADLDVALEKIDPAALPILLQAGSRPVTAVKLLAELATQRNIEVNELHGAVFFDPLQQRASDESAHLEALYEEMATLCRWTSANAPDLHGVAVCTDLWHEAGCSVVHSLAFAMAAGVEHMRRLEEHGLSPEVIAPQVHFSFSIGTDFFMEIAGLRAARLLWARVAAACGADQRACRMRVHCRTDRRSASLLDPHTNLLRTTTEALSAVLGGCDSLHVAPWDELAGRNGAHSEAARRCARNIQIILQRESHLDRVIDPAGGCWYVESLTDELADRAWTLFQEIESAGGMAAALDEGLPRRLVTETRARRERNMATRRDVRVGVNMYATEDDAPAAETASTGRDAEVFERLRATVAAGRAEESADRAQVFVAALGPVAGYMPRLEFTRSFFAVGGLAILESGHFESPANAAEAAADSACPVAVIVSTDKNYETDAAATARALKAVDPPPLILLAGHPGKNRQAWSEAGVDRFIHVRSDVPQIMEELITAIWPARGGQS